MLMNMPSAYERKRGPQFPYGVPITLSSSCIGLVDASTLCLLHMQSFTSGASWQVHGGGTRSNKLSSSVHALLCSGQSLHNEFPATDHVRLLAFQ
jgi:hypothetical protein